jgi:hypothetical protein
MLRVHRFAMRLLCLLLLSLCPLLRAGEPFLKTNDVVALVGGEDMVVASELGYLEVLVQSKLPDFRLKFRGLAWEGDTVFEQRRDLNYPPLEAQLEKIGATVVVAQFGQAESLGGTKNLNAFENSSKTFATRLRGSSKRRLVLITPTPASRSGTAREDVEGIFEFGDAVNNLGASEGVLVVDPFAWFQKSVNGTGRPRIEFETRDGMHLTEKSHATLARAVAVTLLQSDEGLPSEAVMMAEGGNGLRSLVAAKNRLWFNYSRPQNWAFLAGDRTNQPSSRDHIDRNKRWFPEELGKFVPLIEAKEKEIWELAAKLKR